MASSPPAHDEQAPSYVGLLARNRDFRRLWMGTVVSFLGDWVSLIALFTAVQEMTDSALAVAGVLIAKSLPYFLITPFAGPLVDRLDRRRLMIATDLARMVCVGGLVAAHHLGSLPLLLTALVTMVCFSGVFVPARSAVIPQLTSPRELPVAVALSSGTWSVMLAFGAALGGTATEALGVDGALLIDAVTFLASAVFLAGLPPLPPTDDDDPHRDSSFVDGLRHLQGQRYLPGLLLLKTGLTAANGALVALPLYGNGLFAAAAGPAWIGLLYFGRGVGALVGSLGTRRLLGDDQGTYRQAIAPGYLIVGLGLAVVAWAPGIWWATLGFCLAAVGNGIVWVFASTLTQHVTRREYRGRLFSMEFGSFTLSATVAYFVAGQALDTLMLSPRTVVAVSAVLTVLPAVAWTALLATARDIRDTAAPARG